mgnify:CR=1 FL=1
MGRRIFNILLALLVLTSLSGLADAARIKDITHVKGVRSNQLIGYGLVVGLNKSGDSQDVQFTYQSLASMLSRMGVKFDHKQIRPRNVAAVVVTADLPAFANAGSRLDVVVSSIGNAKNLQGGMLLMTPMKGVDGEIYALAQGALSTGGYSFSSQGTEVQKNHPTVARIPGGAIIERELQIDLNTRDEIMLSLLNMDFTTADRVREAIDNYLGGPFASCRDGGTISVKVPEEYNDRVVSLIAKIENLQVSTDRRARVVLNERTGTVIMGSDVRVSTIAISHGSLKIQISTTNQISQPNPFSTGRTMATKESDVNAEEEESKLVIVEAGVSIGDVVTALNAIGASSRDLIDILQAVKSAGALEADLEIL